MALKVSASDGVKVYTVAGGKNIPSWVSDKKKRSLRKDEEYGRRVELLQDFDFPAACQRIKFTPDGEYIFATGYHPPRVRVYDVNQLSMKFERHFDAEIVDFQILAEDYSKAVFLCADRSLCFHARFGAYYKTRIPKFGRDLAYAPHTAELLVAGSAPEVYRMSLCEGRFMAPLSTQSLAINACGISPAHGLVACAGEDGGLECFDLRQRASLGWLNAAERAGGGGQGLTALRFDDAGMNVAVGTSGGLVAVFDLRSQKPKVVKDHMYDAPIVDIKFHSGGLQGGGNGGSLHQRVISSDRHIIKVWDASTGEGYTNIEPAEGCDINDVAVWGHSGLVLAACDVPRIQAYFVPSLGPAPRWCSFLESLTEELEENANPTVYDDYRFVTRSDLDKLGLTHLIGTPLLRAYMHGFFLDNRLYHKAKSVADPFAYEAYRAKRIAEKLEEERKSRISLVRKLPKVNATMAARLIVDQAHAVEKGEAPTTASQKKAEAQAEAAAALLQDDRFKAMFENPEFTIDERSEEYRVLHPNTDPAKDRQLLAEHFEELGGGDVDFDQLAEDEDDGKPGTTQHKEGSSDEDDHYDDSEDDADGTKVRKRNNKRLKVGEGLIASKQPKQAQPRMFVARDHTSAAAFRERRSSTGEKELALGVRSERARGGGAMRARIGGNRELSFLPRMAPDGTHRGGRGGGRGRGRGGGRGRGRGRGR